jgi:hypothetical protein
MLPGTQFTAAPPPTTPGEVGAGPRTPGVTLGLAGTPGLLIVLGLVTPGLVVALGLVVPGLVRDGFVTVALGTGLVVPPIDELPKEDPGDPPVNGCGVEPNVPVIGAPVPGVPPMFGLLMPGAVLELMVGEVLKVPDPVIGAGPTPGVAPKVPVVPDGVPKVPVVPEGVPKVPVVPDGATGDTPVAPGALPTAPVPPAAPGAAVCAKDAGAAAINATATAEIMDFRLSMRVSPLKLQKESCMSQAACLQGRSARRASETCLRGVSPRRVSYSRFATSSSITSVAPPPIDCTRASRVMRSMADSRM